MINIFETSTMQNLKLENKVQAFRMHNIPYPGILAEQFFLLKCRCCPLRPYFWGGGDTSKKFGRQLPVSSGDFACSILIFGGVQGMTRVYGLQSVNVNTRVHQRHTVSKPT